MFNLIFKFKESIFSNLFVKLSLILLSFIHSTIYAQNLGNSPYSTYGIGDISPVGQIRNIGMGNTGVGSSNTEFINVQNSALLSANKGLNKDSTVKYTMLDFGLISIVRNLNQKDQNQWNGGINLAYFNFLFPLSNNWSTMVGLRPLSSTYNKYQNTFAINDSTSKQLEYFSQGALNIVSFDNGFDITKNISLGLHLGYIFGSTSHRNTANFPNNLSPFNPNRIGANYKEFNTAFEIKPGIAYRAILKDSSGKSERIYFNFGLTYNLLLNGKSKRTSELVFINANDGKIILDSNLIKTRYSSLNLPQSISGGISFDQPGKWSIAADFSYTNWSVYKDIYGQSFMRNSYSISLGGEWKPAKNLTLTSKEYRMGLNYTKSPITIDNYQLNDISFSLGSTIPVGRKDSRFKSKPLNKINLALVMGSRGSSANNLVLENYFKLYFGISIQDKWFQRWKIN
ncbi:MAG: hypothetical protein EAZ07_00315 [Cytophagales bacterium]|nr:MAG: hypothetical protein EAZ07_00315 [Cytophagales bacterium]